MRVLLIEDEATLAEIMLLGLRAAGYAADHAPDIGTAHDLLSVYAFDVAILDLGLPDGDGMELLDAFAEGSLARPERVIVLTARDGVADRVAGLDAGADDYVIKPFDFDEVLARIRAVARRADQRTSILTFGSIEVDETAGTARRFDNHLDLTAREWALLRFFLRHPEQTLSAEHLLEHVWDVNTDPFTSSVRVIMSRLRKKLGEPPCIETVIGAGYRLIEA